MEHIIGTNPLSLPVEVQKKRDEIADLLILAYIAEIETAINYLSITRNASGWNGEILRNLLEPEIDEEFNHAKSISERISTLGYHVPSSIRLFEKETNQEQEKLQSVAACSDLRSVISAIKDAERQAINLYVKIIHLCEGFDPGTADLVTHLLADEERHFLVMDRLSSNFVSSR